MTKVTMRVCDTETTGLIAPEAEVIEVGLTDLVFDTETKECAIGEPRATLFRPMHGIPPETSAIHHLLMRDVEGQPICTQEALSALIAGANFVVCHNFNFDGQFLTPEVIAPARAICSLKAAAHIWPDAPGHSNGVLRYWLGLDLDPTSAMPPHRAGPDSYVTAHILAEMLKVASVNQLVRWQTEPRFLPRCPLGKHKGAEWPTVPADYLGWCIRTADMDPDVQHAARLELARRRGEPA